MLITQTPIRVSFFGGGTDFPGYFAVEGGAVLASAINKYIYVVIKERFDDLIRVSYTRTEITEHVDQIQHELVREAMRKTGIQRGVEIVTLADIPSEGSGLGSSSAVTVGLLNAMYNYQGITVGAEQLAREACEIEIDVLKKPIGVQDQYATAFGGLRYMRFAVAGDIQADVLTIPAATRRRLSENLMLFFTGKTRQASSILKEQKENIPQKTGILRQMKDLAEQACGYLQSQDLDAFGALLDHGWQLKKQMASQISNSTIDDLYATARRAGALGGKITGAGGGGFLMLYVPLGKQEEVRAALHRLHELHFHLDNDGSKVIINLRRTGD